ncbi:MAG: helix-turn-helix domain-containing protein [Roseomonas sp.]|nr:helix-turn-helix domain-containing protein [Roseomonas sp.]
MTENDVDSDILDIDGLAAKLRLPKASVYKLVHAERIPGQKVGKHWRFLRSEIDAWLRAGMRTPRRSAAAEMPAAEPMALADTSAPAFFEAAPQPVQTGAAGDTGMQGIFTVSQLAALTERWIETPKQFLAQVERAEGRRRLAELLELSEDMLQQKIIQVAMLAAALDAKATSSPDVNRH